MKSNAQSSLAYRSPAANYLIYSNGESIIGIYTANYRRAPEVAECAPADAVCRQAARQLDEYFAGQRQEFDLPLAPSGTDFDHRVWDELLRIPFGVTCSYGELAAKIGAPKAARAVGAANGRNPISVVIPCHRVIGADGRHVGYGGGLPTKAWLLEHEAMHSQRKALLFR